MLMSDIDSTGYCEKALGLAPVLSDKPFAKHFGHDMYLAYSHTILCDMSCWIEYVANSEKYSFVRPHDKSIGLIIAA